MWMLRLGEEGKDVQRSISLTFRNNNSELEHSPLAVAANEMHGVRGKADRD